MIKVTLEFPDQASLIAFFTGKAVAPQTGKDQAGRSRGENETGASASAAQPSGRAAGEAPGKPAASPASDAPGQRTAEAVAADAPVKSTETPAPPPATEKAAAANSASEPVERAVVSKAAVQLALKDKAKATQILGQFGAKGVKDLPDDKLADVYPLLLEALK